MHSLPSVWICNLRDVDEGSRDSSELFTMQLIWYTATVHTLTMLCLNADEGNYSYLLLQNIPTLRKVKSLN